MILPLIPFLRGQAPGPDAKDAADECCIQQQSRRLLYRRALWIMLTTGRRWQTLWPFVMLLVPYLMFFHLSDFITAVDTCKRVFRNAGHRIRTGQTAAIMYNEWRKGSTSFNRVSYSNLQYEIEIYNKKLFMKIYILPWSDPYQGLLAPDHRAWEHKLNEYFVLFVQLYNKIVLKSHNCHIITHEYLN